MEFPYKHSTGETIGRFLAGLKEQKTIWGRRVAGQGVVVPPHGYSELDASPAGEWVAVKDTGTVTAVAVVHHPARAPAPVRAAVRVRAGQARRRRHGARTHGERRPRPAEGRLRACRRCGRRTTSVRARARHRLLSCRRLIGGAQCRPEPPTEPIKYVEANLYLPYRYVAGRLPGPLHARPEGQEVRRLEVLADRQGLRHPGGQLAGKLRALPPSSSSSRAAAW